MMWWHKHLNKVITKAKYQKGLYYFFVLKNLIIIYFCNKVIITMESRGNSIGSIATDLCQ